MRIAIVLDPLEQIKTYKDSTYAMMVAAQARGHEIHVCGQEEISLVGGQVLARVRRLHLTDVTGTQADWYRLDPDREEALVAFDAVLMRKDPPFDMEYVYSTYLLEHAQRAGARVFNDPRAVRDHNEKLSIAQFPEFTAPTIVTRDPVRLRAFAHEHGEAVFKLLDGMGGASIFRARADDPNLSVIIETLNLFGARTVMAQRFLPQIAEGDKRVLLIGGQVVPYCLARIPKQGEARGNLAAGGTGVARELSAGDRRIAEALAPLLAARGLLLVGLDVIGESLTEVNVTSPTCFQEITQQTGFDVAGLFIDALERAVGG
ncbi:MAG: glutathione synthase [Burkholderiales bacterium]|jgi:glutathione synthase|nr:glutathione synthase [Burkholderiales bacterium]